MYALVVYGTLDRLGAAWSFFVVYGIGVVAGGTALALAVSRLLHHLALRAQDGAAEREKQVLQQGRAVLTGVVDLEDPAAPAVRIRIDEQGREWKGKGGWHHEWRETGRAVEARPFHLVLDHGERLRVEPDERVFLVDALATVERSGIQRVRQAALTHGERVTIVGRLVWGRDPTRAGGSVYRDAGASLCLQAPRNQRLLISASSLAARHAGWIRFYAATVALLAVALAGLHLGFGDYHRLRWGGERVSLPVVQHDTYQTTYKGRLTTHCRISALYQPPGAPGGQRLVDEVNAQAYSALSGRAAEAPFVVLPGNPDVHQVGYAPTISSLAAMMVAFGAFVSALFFYMLWRNQVPWYEQEQVVERGSGRLFP